MTAESPDNVDECREGVDAFLQWLAKNGYESFDPYDVWGTRIGILARRLYYAKPILGMPLVVPILLLEILFPAWRALGLKRQRYSVADAHLALAFMNLYEVSGQNHYLEKATALATDLLASSVPGYHGYCWGYPFDWQSNRKLYRKNTPFITTTPYGFEVFLRLFELTGQEAHLEAARSIARFAAEDLHDTEWSEDASASSYSPEDRDKVVNASAYRAFVLLEAAARFGDDQYREQARKNVNFVLQSQRDDGSWFYGMGDSGSAFIDHFHTCFVLKNLYKLNRRLGDPAVDQAIERGFQYYRRALFDEEGIPIPFAVKPRLQLVRLELYDVAEAISLGVLLREVAPEGLALSMNLASRVCRRYQLGDGHFVTRIYVGGIRHTLPYLRWPQAQLFYALTNLMTVSPAEGRAA